MKIALKLIMIVVIFGFTGNFIALKVKNTDFFSSFIQHGNATASPISSSESNPQNQRTDKDIPLRQLLPEFVALPFGPDTLMVSATEVSQKHWQQCVDAGVCADVIQNSDNKNEMADKPMVDMSYLEVKQYLQWLRDKTGLSLNIPSENQWLYLAGDHAPEDRPPLFDDPDLAWAADYDLTAVPQSKQTQPLKAFGANSWGIFDIKGNVWEWVDNCHWPQAERNKDEYGCIGGRIAMGERKAGLAENLRKPGNGSCYGDQPPANIGLRLVYIQ